MNTKQRVTARALVAVALFGVGGCSDMSTRDRDTAIGAGAGAVGGLIGNQIGKDKK